MIKHVRESKPLIHNITNQVVMNFSANGLLAFGALPIMADAQEDAPEITRVADGLLLNMGTISEYLLYTMINAGKVANHLGIPLVIDPVGVGASDFRSACFDKLIKEVHPTAIKGNAGELAHLVGVNLQTKGVEAIEEGNPEQLSKLVAEKYQTVAILTGKIDVISNVDHMVKNNSGHPLLSKITGAGCLLGSIITACLTVPGREIINALTAVEFYGLAAERALSHQLVQGPGTFLPHFLDNIAIEPKGG